MNSSRPISAARTVWLIAGLALRRQLNLFQSARFSRKKQPPGVLPPASTAPRSATPAKSRGRSALSIFVMLFMAFNGFNIGARGLLSLSAASSQLTVSPDKIPVSASTIAGLVRAEKAFQRAG